MLIYKRFLILMTVLLAATADAAGNAPATPQDYCPAPESLQKEDLIWSAPGGWVSYSESFDKKIVGFVKAEWIGVNVGKIICLYKGNQVNSFPVALELKHNKLVPIPSGAQWGKEHNGRKECLAGAVKDCPFQFEKSAEDKNIYQDLDFFKDKKNQTE